MQKNLLVEKGGQRLDKYLHEQNIDYSRSWLQKLIRDKKVWVNKKPAKPHLELRDGDHIEMDLAPPPAIDLSPDSGVKWETIHKSPDYIVLNKPAGLVVHPSEGIKSGTLVNGLLHVYPDISRVGEDVMRPGIVHRLDKDVSGLMIVALKQQAFEYFKKMFQTHQVTKNYTALVYGTGLAQSGKITFPLARSRNGKIVSISDGDQSHKKQKWAETDYEILKEYTNYLLLRVTTLTGRTHQIRAHLHGLGHPIVGDSIYRVNRYQKLESTKQPFLCADYISFTDTAGIKKEFRVSLPEVLESFLREL